LHGAKDDGVLLGKILDREQRRCMVWDIERGSSNEIEPEPWQTDTCIGGWHYDKGVFERHRYKSSKTVVQTLIDVVSKNGNLLLDVPLKGDGSPDSDEIAIVEGIAKWMEVNKEAILGTRPWKVLGEGPQMATAAPLKAQGFNEGHGRQFSAEDVRFTTKGDTLYVFVMGAPSAAVNIKSLGTDAKLLQKSISAITLLGSTEKLKWSQTADALVIEKPKGQISEAATVFKITPKG
jgi:alpha-L-fucosidase